MKKLLMIGAGFLQDFVIRKAVSMGYEVHALDANPHAVGFLHAQKHAVIDIVNEEACLGYAREQKVDGVMTAATDFGVMTAAFIAGKMGLKGISYDTAKLVKNKYLTRRALMDAHVDDTAQAWEVTRETDVASLAKRLEYPVMVKPCDGSGSRGAGRVDTPGEFQAACEKALLSSRSCRALVESFITGKEYGAESLVTDGQVHVLAVMKKWMTPAPCYAELGHAVPSMLPPETENKARKCVEAAIRALKIDFGSVNMDMLITDDGKVYIIDIGARMGGNMIGPCVVPYGTGIDYMGAAIRAVMGDGVDLTPRDHGAVATRLLAFEEGTVLKVPDMARIEKECGVEIYHHLRTGEHVRKYRTNLDGCGYVVARAADVASAAAAADEAYRRIAKEAFEA